MKNINLRAQEKSVGLMEINQFELDNGFKLPKSYKTFLSNSNGGVPRERIYWDPENELELGISHFESLKYGSYPLEDILENVYTNETVPRGFVPFASDGGSGQYILSTNSEDFGEIYVIYSDSEEPFKLCDSFDDFINRLEE